MSQQENRVFNDRYELRRHIARGGMAEVYLAHDRLLDRPVALKMLFPELSVDRAFVERFRREAQAAANLTHPNIVSVYDWGEDENTYFIVMEYIDGQPLSTVLRNERTLLPDRAADIAAPVAAALEFAHRHGVIHRDVKPGNVLLTADGGVKVTDFGIARAANVEENLTQTGAVMGTATYFSPEQAQGTTVDGRSDVYSLGVVLYELVTGRPPFAGDNPVTIAYKHVGETPVPPRQRNSAVPAAFEAIILKAMAKDPAERYQSAEELRADLLRFRQGRTVMATPPPVAATQAVPATTVQSRYAGDGGTTVIPAAAGAGAYAVTDRPRRGNGAFIGVLFVMLAVLLVLLFLLGRQLGVFGSSSSKQVVVPSVIGLDAPTAETQLKGAGLTPKQVLEANQDNPQGKVFDQDPKADAKVDRNSTVTIKVSSGAASVPIPDVVNQNVDDATGTLQQAGFNVTTTLKADDKRDPGTVLSQSPGAGTTAKQGSTVTLTVSSGKAKVSVPDETGKDATQAAADLGSAGLNVSRTDQPSSTVDQGKVISTNPPPGTQVDKGSTVTIVVSSGAPTTTTTARTTILPPPSTTTTTTPTTTTTGSSTTSTTRPTPVAP